MELECVCARPDLLGRGLPLLEVARSEQHRQAVCHEFLCDLKTDSLIGPGHQGDAFVLRDNLLYRYFFTSVA
jgi:hypothetical protein